jgi:hypothetical protein
MSTIIKDGSGGEKSAKVGSKNRIHTHALSASSSSVASVSGEAFNISSELVTLTSDSESGILYLKNEEEFDISITTEFVNLGTSTGGTGSSIIRFYLSPTGGTLISDATAASVDNRRVGDNESLSVLAYRGVEGSSISGGSDIPIPRNGAGPIASEYIIPKGSSFALSVTPPSGNTSMPIQIGFLVIKCYREYTVD